VESIGESVGSYVPTVGRSGWTRKISALIVVIFEEILETVAATYASIGRINARAPRSRSYGLIASRFGPTRMRLESTAATCG